jgi:prolyl oligopeptidase
VTSTAPAPGAAPRDDLVETIHGVDVADPYRWLEDPDSEQTRAWGEQQDEMFADAQAAWPLRGHFAERVTQLLQAGSVSAPAWRGQRQFFSRRTAEQEHSVLLTVDADGVERVLFDPMAVDPSGGTTLDSWQPSKEGHLLAYQISEGGREESVLRVLDVVTGLDVDGPIDRARYSPVAWLPGGEAFYYVRRLPPELVPEDESQYHRRVYLHRLGDSPSADVEIFGAGRLMTEYYGVSVSMDGRWLVVSASEGTAPRNDLWIADLSTGDLETPQLRTVQSGVDAQTGLHVGRDGRMYVFTDADAPRGRLAVADPLDPEPANWTDLVPEDAEAVLDGFAILDGPEGPPTLLCSWTRHGIGEITVHGLDGERRGVVELPGLGSISGIVERPEGGHEAWFAYTDETHPVSVWRYDARTDDLSLWANPPGTVQPPPVRSRQVTYRSSDGTQVRMLLTEPADTTGPRPVLLNGYGGFGLSLTPAYSAAALAWVEAGGVYAVANIRGGGEEGEQWHRDGMLANKEHCFDDFEAAAQWLIDEGITTGSQLAIMGGSNGGLLVGACLTRRPELFAAVVCSAPLLDMVRYEKFGLGATWNVEYGTAADPEQFGWLYSYSPYHHVRDQVSYPAVQFQVFDGDTRVDPMHARKMCAALQHSTAGGPVVLRRETDVGHGARAISRSVALIADTLGFAAAMTGMNSA